MKKIITLLLLIPVISFAQKKPLDHTVYDSWQRIDEKLISANGKFVAYTIALQEGDANLVIQSTKGNKLIEVARGYNVNITDDDKFVVFKIKPTYKQTRDAKIAKKKPDEMPKDSLGIYDVEQNKLEKIARVKSYKVPEKAGGWLAYLMEKPLPEIKEKKELDSIGKLNELTNKAAAMQKQIDSLNNLIAKAQEQGINILSPKKDTTAKPKKEDDVEEGTELVLRNLTDGKQQKIKLVQEYYFSKYGNRFLVETTKKNNSNAKSFIMHFHLKDGKRNSNIDTLLTNFFDAKQFAFSEIGEPAFVATFDSTKTEQKEYNLYYYSELDRNPTIQILHRRVWDYEKHIITNEKVFASTHFRINENAPISFSKSGEKLLFGTSPKLPIKDTTLPEFERVSIDVWNYKDDDLMTVQLKNLDAETKKSYLAMYSFDYEKMFQLGSPKFEPVRVTQEGDGKYFYALSDSGKRVEQQWQGYTKKDIFVINSYDGSNKQIMSNVRANIYPSYTGKFLLVYDEDKKQYSCYDADSNKIKPVAKDIPYPLYDEENDVPDAPNAYGIVKWLENDKYVLIYDRYDLWKVDPTGKEKSICITNGRKDKIQYRYVTVDNDEKFIKEAQELVVKCFDENYKTSFYKILNTPINQKGEIFVFNTTQFPDTDSARLFFVETNITSKDASIGNLLKSKKSKSFIVTKENFRNNPNLFSSENNASKFVNSFGKITSIEVSFFKPLTDLNPQQSNYLWGSAELFKWKAYTGKLTEGVLYKPENFDSTKKYPMIVYFYERNNQTLHQYQAPAPTPSRLNIPYFVSNGYVVFVPDIWYTTGHPGKSAYDYIVSGTRALIKKGFIDSTKIGLQGQSWGGYQTAYLITQTNLYKAAWAGAPVSNMFSAYGGIRWESGLNRQFQYEHSQSRIGATMWEKPNLYIENSPLFHLPKVKTPLVIMHNDADGAVPWYQGIELFTAMRRLNKPVWMLNYNGEAHNLMERKNRKDIQVKEQQFFDWLLKDAPAPKWITEGVPAVMKGRVGVGTGN
jgi:dipeptidyl aminopeptidase/acylaminoacyl peptidase